MTKVSIILPTYNSSFFIHEAISSILKQTHKNLELIIIDDNSTDETIKIIKSFRDQRIRLIVNKKKIGVASSLNLGIKHSKSKFIARMDSDDISEPNRIEEQLKFLLKNKKIHVVGTAIKVINEAGIITKFVSYPETSIEIKWSMCLGCSIVHPSVMMRKYIFEKYGKYRQTDKIEDYSLWTRLLDKGVKFHNINKYLIRVRKHSKNSSKIALLKYQNIENKIVKRNIFNSTNVQLSEKNNYNLNILRTNNIYHYNYTLDLIQFLKFIFSQFCQANKELISKKILKSLHRSLFEKILIIKIRSLKNYNNFIHLFFFILINFRFITFLFLKISTNFYKILKSKIIIN